MVEKCIRETYERRFSLKNSALTVAVEQERLIIPKGSVAELSALCRDKGANNRASNLINGTGGRSLGGEDHGVCYAIEAVGFGHTKIGITWNPINRLTNLQQSHFAILRISGLLWLDGMAEANVVESLALRAADEMGIRANGEWVRTGGPEATEILLKAARYSKLNCYDSATAIENIGRRVEKLRDSKVLHCRLSEVDEYAA